MQDRADGQIAQAKSKFQSASNKDNDADVEEPSTSAFKEVSRKGTGREAGSKRRR